MDNFVPRCSKHAFLKSRALKLQKNAAIYTLEKKKIHQRVKGLHGFTIHCESNQVCTNHVPVPEQQQISLLDALFSTSLTKQSITKLVINLSGPCHTQYNSTP